jgi:hypothetical protein
MSRRLVLVAVCAFLVLLVGIGGAVGYFLAAPFSSASAGQSRPSPDGRWVAHALTFKQGTFFGRKRSFFELRIDSPPPSIQTVRKMVIEDTAEPSIDWRLEGEVFWNRNGSSVTFKCVTGKANLEISLVP